CGGMLGVALVFTIMAVTAGGVDLDPRALGRFFAFDTGGTANVLGIAAVVTILLTLSLFVAYLSQFMAAYHRRERMMSRFASQVRVVTDAERLLADHLRAGSRESLDRV